MILESEAELDERKKARERQELYELRSDESYLGEKEQEARELSELYEREATGAI